MTGTFHCLSHSSLELEGSSCDATGKYLTLLIEEFLQELRILVIDIFNTWIYTGFR